MSFQNRLKTNSEKRVKAHISASLRNSRSLNSRSCALHTTTACARFTGERAECIKMATARENISDFQQMHACIFEPQSQPDSSDTRVCYAPMSAKRDRPPWPLLLGVISVLQRNLLTS